MEAVALKLVNVVLSFFHALASQNAFALLMNLQHVEFGFLLRPTEHLLKDVGDVSHQIHWVIPANDQVTGFQSRF